MSPSAPVRPDTLTLPTAVSSAHVRAVVLGKRWLDPPTGREREIRDFNPWPSATCGRSDVEEEWSAVVTEQGLVRRLMSCGKRGCPACAVVRRRRWLDAVEVREVAGDTASRMLTFTPPLGWRQRDRGEFVRQVRLYLRDVVRAHKGGGAIARVEVGYGGFIPPERLAPCACAAAKVEPHPSYPAPVGREGAAFSPPACLACFGAGKMPVGHVHVHAVLWGVSAQGPLPWRAKNGKTNGSGEGLQASAASWGLELDSRGIQDEPVRVSGAAYVAKYLAKEQISDATRTAIELRRCGITREWSTMGSAWGCGGQPVRARWTCTVGELEADAGRSFGELTPEMVSHLPVDVERDPDAVRVTIASARVVGALLDGRAQSAHPSDGGGGGELALGAASGGEPWALEARAWGHMALRFQGASAAGALALVHGASVPRRVGDALLVVHRGTTWVLPGWLDPEQAEALVLRVWGSDAERAKVGPGPTTLREMRLVAAWAALGAG